MKQVYIGPIKGHATSRLTKSLIKFPTIALAMVASLLFFVPLFMPKIAKAPSDICAVALVDNGMGTGSAIYIGNNMMLTAAHVVDGMFVNDFCKVTFENPNQTDGPKISALAQVVALGDRRTGDENDYAMLQVVSLDVSKYVDAYALGVSKNAKINDQIRVVGYPNGFFMSTDGTINSIKLGENAELFTVSANAWPGNSGGALLDKSGKVIGIVTLGGVDITTIGQTGVVKIDYIRKQLSQSGIQL